MGRQMRDYVEKVTAFVTRPARHGVDLLLFEHPHAGVQIPAGTCDPAKGGAGDETPEQAVLREVLEETGLGGLVVRALIGWRDELPPGTTHVVARRATLYSRPDPASFDWASLRRGIGVRLLRQSQGFAQVTYEEGDRYPDPRYISYLLTGWLEEDALARACRRYFFHLEAPATLTVLANAPEPVPMRTDGHIFRPFWARFDHLPEIVAPQRAWLDFVTQELKYGFR